MNKLEVSTSSVFWWIFYLGAHYAIPTLKENGVLVRLATRLTPRLRRGLIGLTWAWFPPEEIIRTRSSSGPALLAWKNSYSCTPLVEQQPREQWTTYQQLHCHPPMRTMCPYFWKLINVEWCLHICICNHSVERMTLLFYLIHPPSHQSLVRVIESGTSWFCYFRTRL